MLRNSWNKTCPLSINFIMGAGLDAYIFSRRNDSMNDGEYGENWNNIETRDLETNGGTPIHIHFDDKIHGDRIERFTNDERNKDYNI